MINPLKVKKNQHYVPQSYLRRFTIDGEKSLIWSFDKNKFEFEKLRSSVNKICSEDYYYYQQDSAGGFDHIKLEDSLSEVEKIGNDAIIKIVNSFAMPYAAISEKERAEFGFYVSLMLTRGPAFRDCINSLYGSMATRTLRSMYESGGFPEAPDILNEIIEAKGIENVINTEVFSSVSLRGMIEVARQISLINIKKEWVFTVAPSGHEFITSDTPVSFTSASGLLRDLGPGHPDAKIIFPISKKIALVIVGKRGNKDMNFKTCEVSEVEVINQQVANSANSYIFCSERYNWLPRIITNRTGQRLVVNTRKSGFSIVDNPYKKRKLTIQSSRPP